MLMLAYLLAHITYIMAIDLDNGAIYSDYADKINPSDTNLLKIYGNPGTLDMQPEDYRLGRIFFPAIAAGHTMRVYYRSTTDLAIQPHRSFHQYSQLLPETSSDSDMDNQHLHWISSDPQHLWFVPSEAGKTIDVTIGFLDTNGYQAAHESHIIPLPPPIPPVVTLDTIISGTPYIFARTKPITNVRAVWIGAGKSEVLKERSISGRTEFLNEIWRQAQVTTFLTPGQK